MYKMRMIMTMTTKTRRGKDTKNALEMKTHLSRPTKLTKDDKHPQINRETENQKPTAPSQKGECPINGLPRVLTPYIVLSKQNKIFPIHGLLYFIDIYPVIGWVVSKDIKCLALHPPASP